MIEQVKDSVSKVVPSKAETDRADLTPTDSVDLDFVQPVSFGDAWFAQLVALLRRG